MKAVILAGGKGRRLKPYSTVFPKPLMPVGERPILEIILNQLKKHGITDITLAVGYLSEYIMTFFGDGSNLDIKIDYSKESKPLGTAGCLGLLKDRLDEPFLMMNGDILTSLNFSELINFHKKNKAIATVALNKREVYIDFGTVKIKKSIITEYIEKPRIEYLVSMGIYIFDPKVLNYVKSDEYLDFPDLVNVLLRNRETINAFTYDGYWLDIGRPDDYEKANNDIKKILPSIM